MKKQLLSILLCLIMVVGLLPTAALAEEAAPPFDLTKDLVDIKIPDDLVTCICTKTGESKSYGKLPGGFSASSILKEDGFWTVLISVKPDVYMAQFNKDTGSTHSPDINHYTDFTTKIQFKLKYEGSKWVPLGEMPQNKMLHFTCGGGHVYQGAAPTIALVSRTDTDIKVTENNKWEYSKDNGVTWQDSCHFTNLQPGTEYTIIARVKATATHQPSANSEPLNISTIGSAITEEDLAELDIPANLVTVKCQTTGDSKEYGRIPGGFDLSNSTPYKENGVLKAIVKLNLPAYKAKYDADTKKTHERAGLEGNTHTAFTLKYVNDKWEPDGTFPAVVLLVTCNGSHENQTCTVTFNGNGGVPSVIRMTTIDQKLPELPTATHSGRYSFDGWYTAASGGTKITTATVFYENTTVHAHWTYIGGGGSSGGGGGGSGHTYHTIRAISGLNGSISPSGWTSVRHGWDQTFAITPDKGYAVAKVLVDGKSVGSVKSYTFKNVTKDHTIEVVFMKANGNPQTGVFVDVPEGSYYEEAVDWAVEKGITTGTGNNYFTPDGICTRAQAVTFLWRVAGSPTPKTEAMVFEDVLDGSYYYEAALWAVENGITVGTSATTFSPELTCSRAHIVTFLWRAANSPSVKMDNPFTDVAADAYYIDAVLWAVKHKITVGTTLSTFSPDEGCTRAQIVTFLYRAHSK